jgi:hypothetical protein
MNKLELLQKQLKLSIDDYKTELDLVKQDYRFTKYEVGEIERLEYMASELKIAMDNMARFISNK